MSCTSISHATERSGRATTAFAGLRVPAHGPGVCPRCRGPAPRRGQALECWCCRSVGAQLGRDAAVPLVAMWACRPGDGTHQLLRLYKDGPISERRARFASVLAEALGSFLERHDDCVRAALGAFDAIAVVPSSRVGSSSAHAWRHPLESVVAGVPALAGRPVLRLQRGPEVADHLRASRHAFVAPECARGWRVLVAEDTWVTGARARSAAAAVVEAGGEVAGILVLGRAVDPSASPKAARWWAQARVETALAPDGCGLSRTTL